MSRSIERYSYLLAMLLIAGAFVLSINTPVPRTEQTASNEVLADVTCTTGSTIITPIPIDQFRTEIKLDAQTLTGISRVDFVMQEGSSGGGSETVIGRGFRDTATLQQWRMIWDTRYYKPITAAFPARFRATIHFTSNTSCSTAYSSQISIAANGIATIPKIEAVIDPPQWDTFVNTNRTIFVNFLNLPPDLQQYVIVKWIPDIGFVANANSRSSNYSSGSTAGSGKLRVFANYAGQEIQAESEIVVYTTTSTTNSTSSGGTSFETNTTTSTSDNSNTITTNTDDSDDLPAIDDDAELEDIITILAPTTAEPSALSAPSRAIALVLQSNDEVKTCISTSAGEDTLSTILRENRRPRSEEFKRFIRCFEPQRNVIPSILAPVAPEEVTQLEQTERVSIKSLANSVKRTNEETEQTTLEIAGTAQANSDVLLYVFSEPLVLATTADNDGNWSYTLEDPLDPGEHEVYAMVDRGDGVYERSSVTSFFIGTAAATEENPNGLSLELVSEPTITASNRSANLYIAATIGIITFSTVIIVSYLFFSYRKHRLQKTTQPSNPPAPVTGSDSTYKQFTDGQ